MLSGQYRKIQMGPLKALLPPNDGQQLMICTMGQFLTRGNELLADLLTSIDCYEQPWSQLTLCPKA